MSDLKNKHVEVSGFNRELFTKMEEIARTAGAERDSGGYVTLKEPIVFRVGMRSFWYLRKLKGAEGYNDSGVLSIHGAGASDLDSVVDEPVHMVLYLNTGSGSFNYTS